MKVYIVLDVAFGVIVARCKTLSKAEEIREALEFPTIIAEDYKQERCNESV